MQEVIRQKIIFIGVPRHVSVTYTAVLNVSEDSVLFLSGLLHVERARRGTRKDTRASSTTRSPSAPSCTRRFGYDHRLIDGAVADQFMALVKKTMEGWSEDVG